MKEELFRKGIETCARFLELNAMPTPEYLTYEEALREENLNHADHERRFACRVLDRHTRGPMRLQGTGTGLYTHGYVFVNLAVTAAPVQIPSFRSWSWPGWKTDRTACGVVAHEVGHHVTEKLNSRTTPKERVVLREKWASAARGKRVSGYEPTLEEAGAETLRLFILNPALLRDALPRRYAFLFRSLGLKPLPDLLNRGWRKVLANDNYFDAAERWIGVRR